MTSRGITARIEVALSQKYAAPEYAFLLQVRNGTGFQRSTRTADALAFSLYPSRGLSLTGFEIKASRGDWKRELANPEKAEDICGYCDYWYVVAPKDVVPIDEVPLTWGLIEIGSTGKLRTVKAAPITEAKPLDRLMIASIMRNMTKGMIHRDSIKDEVQAARDQAVKDADREMEYRTRNYTELRKAIDAFEEVSGVRIQHYRGGDIGEAVRQVMRLKSDPGDYLKQLGYIRDGVHRLDTELASAIEQIGKAVADA